MNLNEIEKRLAEIENRTKEIELEAPLLIKAHRHAKASGNGAEKMVVQIAMASRLAEVQALSREIQRIRKTLGV